MLSALLLSLVFQAVQPSHSQDRGARDIKHIQEDDPMLPFFPTIVENVTVSHGRKAVLKCEVENLRNYKVAWVRVDTQTILTIHNNVISRNPRLSLSRPAEKKWDLHIDSVQEIDRGWYMCQINTDPMVHRSGYLEVVVPPRIVSSESSSLVVREGDNVSLSCEASGYPPPHIVWRREDGDDILIGGRKVGIVERAVLKLDKISRLHMADYLCVASNGIPPSASKGFSIKVQFPPMFWIPSQLEGAYLGQDITIECHSEAFPKSINYWVNNRGAMLLSNDKYETVTVDSGYKIYMKLHIRNISRTDYMEYRCIAKNSLGHSDGSITLYEVSPPTVPSTTEATTTTLLTSTTPEEEEEIPFPTRPHHKRKKVRQRGRLKEMQRHSYTLEEQDMDREEEKDLEREDHEELTNIISNRNNMNRQREINHEQNREEEEQANNERSFLFGPRSTNSSGLLAASRLNVLLTALTLLAQLTVYKFI